MRVGKNDKRSSQRPMNVELFQMMPECEQKKKPPTIMFWNWLFPLNQKWRSHGKNSLRASVHLRLSIHELCENTHKKRAHNRSHYFQIIQIVNEWSTMYLMDMNMLALHHDVIDVSTVLYLVSVVSSWYQQQTIRLTEISVWLGCLVSLYLISI